jgi:hypothetical protein
MNKSSRRRMAPTAMLQCARSPPCPPDIPRAGPGSRLPSEHKPEGRDSHAGARLPWRGFPSRPLYRIWRIRTKSRGHSAKPALRLQAVPHQFTIIALSDCEQAKGRIMLRKIVLAAMMVLVVPTVGMAQREEHHGRPAPGNSEGHVPATPGRFLYHGRPFSRVHLAPFIYPPGWAYRLGGEDEAGRETLNANSHAVSIDREVSTFN